MATANKILGQLAPSAATLTTLYTVPAATQANVNIFVCNRSVMNTTIGIGIVKSGGSIFYIAYDTICNINTPINITGIVLAAGDYIQVYNTLATCSFNATGIEIA
jgi:hypothetical protein